MHNSVSIYLVPKGPGEMFAVRCEDPMETGEVYVWLGDHKAASRAMKPKGYLAATPGNGRTNETERHQSQRVGLGHTTTAVSSITIR
jgi:hypothetical protein